MAEQQADEGAEKQGAGQKRRRRRSGTPGVSYDNKPMFTKEFRPEVCCNCGRTDVSIPRGISSQSIGGKMSDEYTRRHSPCRRRA